MSPSRKTNKAEARGGKAKGTKRGAKRGGLGSRILARLRNYLFTGVIVIAPSAIAIWALFLVVRWFDDLLRPWVPATVQPHLDFPGRGIVVSVVLLVLIGWATSWIGTRWLLGWWDRLLTRIPGVGILYASAKSLGEAIFTPRRQAFRQVVLLQWPHAGVWRVGFVTGEPAPEVRAKLSEDHEVVFVPHTPNPASGFVQYVPRSQLVYLDWPVEEGLKMIMSGGVVQPEGESSGSAR
jgi:uncharacterized membrane protein